MLNVNKTEFVVFTYPQNQGKIDMEKCVLTVGEEKIFHQSVSGIWAGFRYVFAYG